MSTKSRKRRKLTERDQQIAAEILTRFMFTKTFDEVIVEWQKVYEDFCLCDDPFTHTCCSPGQYSENSLEYERQTMEELYGHCDGLD